MALDTFNPYLFVSAGEQSNKFLTPTYADGIAQFQAQRAQPLTGLTVRIDPIQEGTGDPSPDNIRPISGRTGLTVTVQSGETQNEYPVTWETEAGAIYGGTLNVTTGVLTVDRGINVIDGTQLVYDNGTQTYGGIQLKYIPTPAKAFAPSPVMQNYGLMSDKFGTTQAYADSEYQVTGRPTNGYVYFNMPASVTTTVQAREWFTNNPTRLVYELATPQTYQLSPTDVKTLAGFNQVYSDAGPVIDIKF